NAIHHQLRRSRGLQSQRDRTRIVAAAITGRAIVAHERYGELTLPAECRAKSSVRQWSSSRRRDSTVPRRSSELAYSWMFLHPTPFDFQGAIDNRLVPALARRNSPVPT